MYAENLKKIRKELNLSVEKLAQTLEIPASTIWGYESKKRTPSIDLPIQLYRKFNINLNWFLVGEGEMFNKNDCLNISSKVELENFVINLLVRKGLLKEE